MTDAADRTAAPAALEGTGPSSARRTCPTCGSTDIVPGGYATSLGALDACRRCDAALWPEQAKADPAPAAPAPAVEAMASLDVMAERALRWFKHRPTVLRTYGEDAADMLAHALTGLPPGSERDVALSAILARLGAEPPADPARATLDGAVRAEDEEAWARLLCNEDGINPDVYAPVSGMPWWQTFRRTARACMAFAAERAAMVAEGGDGDASQKSPSDEVGKRDTPASPAGREA